MEHSEDLGRFEVTLEIAVRSCVEEDLPALEWMGLFSAHRDIIPQAFEAQQCGDALMLLAVTAGFPVGQVGIDFARRRSEGAAFIWGCGPSIRSGWCSGCRAARSVADEKADHASRVALCGGWRGEVGPFRPLTRRPGHQSLLIL